MYYYATTGDILLYSGTSTSTSISVYMAEDTTGYADDHNSSSIRVYGLANALYYFLIFIMYI